MTGGEQHRQARGADSPCEATAIGKNARPRPCPFVGAYEGVYGLVLCGHHLRVYERAVTLGQAGRKDHLRGLADAGEPIVAPEGELRGVFQGFYAA